MNRKLLAAMLLVGMVVLLCVLEVVKTDSVTVMASDETSAGNPAPQEPPDEPASPFEAYTYCRAEYLDRYADYQTRMPDLDAGTVVWHVNAGLDSEPYTRVIELDGAHPLLVNKWHRLPEGFEPAELTVIHGSVQATPGTAEAFARMRSAAMQEGVFIEAAAGYRSVEAQGELFAQQELYLGAGAAEAAVARPGHGERSTGRALHIVDRDYTYDGFDAMPEFAWLMDNCAEYGFILRYGQGAEPVTGFAYAPYHFTFVGRDIAVDMREQGIDTLEEYVARGLAAPSGDMPVDDRAVVVLVAGYGAEDNAYETGMAQLIKERLEAEDVRVVITNSGDDVAAETRAAALVGLERSGGEGLGGAVAWFASDRPESAGFAATVDSRLTWAGLDVESRGIYEDAKIALTRLTGAPAVLLEVDGAWMGDDYCERVARSVSDAVVAHLGLRVMYLTFDDGPSAEYTPAVLDILRERGVKATFFVVGAVAEQHPDTLRDIVAEGHALGIHSYSHDYGQIYTSVESFFEDFYRARDVVREITGLEPDIYRFPGGSVNNYNAEVYDGIVAEMDRLGIVYHDWNITAEDALGSVEPGELLDNIRSQTRYRNAVLLMHDAYPNIVAELEDIIDHFADYQMAVIGDGTSPVQFVNTRSSRRFD